MHQVNQVNLVKPWATNQQQLQSKDDTEACTFKSIILSMILPNIPHTSQDEHLSIQCGGGNDPQVYSWSKPAIPCSSGRLTQSICLSNSAPVQACPSNTQNPILHLSKFNTMTSTNIKASEDQPENEDDPFSCTFKNVIVDHLVHLLPVYSGGYSSLPNHLSIQCGQGEDLIPQSSSWRKHPPLAA